MEETGAVDVADVVAVDADRPRLGVGARQSAHAAPRVVQRHVAGADPNVAVVGHLRFF